MFKSKRLMGPLSYFWWSNSNLVKRLFMAPFFRNNLFGSFWMKLISVKKENRFKLTQCQTLDFALVDTRCLIFNFCWYQTFDFVIVDFSLILLRNKTLFCDDYKEKVRRVYSKKTEREVHPNYLFISSLIWKSTIRKVVYLWGYIVND